MYFIHSDLPAPASQNLALPFPSCEACFARLLNMSNECCDFMQAWEMEKISELKFSDKPD